MSGLVLNNTIVSSPVVLFLGAGASAGLGYKTSDELLGTAKANLSKKRWVQVRAILNLPRLSRIEAGTRQPGIEEVLRMLNEWRVAMYLMKREAVPKIIFGNMPKLELQLLEKSYQKISELRNELMDLLARHYSGCDPVLASSHYSWLFKTLMEQASYLPVFSTNYDWSVELSAIDESSSHCRYRVVDGFHSAAGGEFEPGLFHNFVPQGYPTILLFRLHGSTAWFWMLGMGIVRSFNYVDLSRLSRGKIDRVMIYPGGQNLDWYMMSNECYVDRPYRNVNPFRTMYAYLSQCLLQARLCVVVGYSFPLADEQIRETFQQALTLNKNLHILLINPAEPFIEGMTPQDLAIYQLKQTTGLDLVDLEINRNRIHMLQAYFGHNEDKPSINKAIQATMEKASVY